MSKTIQIFVNDALYKAVQVETDSLGHYDSKIIWEMLVADQESGKLSVPITGLNYSIRLQAL